MPIYEFHCDKCDKDFEDLVIDDDPVACPTCGSKKVNKLMSACAHKSGGEFVPSSGGTGCSSCSSGSCSSCH